MSLSMNRWKGKVAVITGASAGIGAAMAEKLVEHGVKVVGIARRVERIDELAKKLSGKSGKLYGFKGDLGKEEDIIKAFEWTTKNVGPVHILINNAGLMQPTTLIEGDSKMWQTVFDINVLALCIATREAVKIMKSEKIDGHIIHINSVVGHMVPNFPGTNVYPASKHSVTALTETLRQEFNQNGLKIKITSLSPGVVSTEFLNNTPQTGDGADLAAMIKNLPSLRGEDIADAAVYVLSTPPHVQVHELTICPVGEVH